MLGYNSLLREMEITEICGERRSRRRYPIELPVSFKLLKHCMVIHSGTGRTINVSSTGIAFYTEGIIPVRSFLELSIAWPVKLDDSCPLKLVASGRVVRSEPGCTVMQMEHYIFRTQGSAAQQVPQPCAMAAGG